MGLRVSRAELPSRSEMFISSVLTILHSVITSLALASWVFYPCDELDPRGLETVRIVWNNCTGGLTDDQCGPHCALCPAITVRLKPGAACRAAAVPEVRSERTTEPGAITGSVCLYLPGAQPPARNTGRQGHWLPPPSLNQTRGGREIWRNISGCFHPVSTSRISWPWPWDTDIMYSNWQTGAKYFLIIFLRHHHSPHHQWCWWGVGRQERRYNRPGSTCACNTDWETLVPPS